jgi:hypothetical protein
VVFGQSEKFKSPMHSRESRDVVTEAGTGDAAAGVAIASVAAAVAQSSSSRFMG